MSEGDSLSSEVIFVYLGRSLPNYAVASLNLAVRFSGMKVRLLGNARLRRSVSNPAILFTAVEDFYDPTEFLSAAQNTSLPRSFRGGFWLKALERFFVLDQFRLSSGGNEIFHAELDQLLFRTDQLVDRLRQLPQQGLFLPFHNKRAAVASVLYCNNADALRSFIKFSSRNTPFATEMELIAKWATLRPELCFPLPTMRTLITSQSKSAPRGTEPLTPEDLGGVVDAAQLGQWVGGVDPRNLPLSTRPTNKFVDSPEKALMTHNQLKKVRFDFREEDSTLFCHYAEDFSVRVFNLHLHAKIHSWLQRSDPFLISTFRFANQSTPVAIPETRRFQVEYHLKAAMKDLAYGPIRMLMRVTSHSPDSMKKQLSEIVDSSSRVVAHTVSGRRYIMGWLRRRKYFSS